jgi:hypothetical protein
MYISPYDFDTRFAPFEGFAAFTPCAPYALCAAFVAPMYACMDTWLNAYGQFTDLFVRTMTSPLQMQPAAESETSPEGVPVQ